MRRFLELGRRLGQLGFILRREPVGSFAKELPLQLGQLEQGLLQLRLHPRLERQFGLESGEGLGRPGARRSASAGTHTGCAEEYGREAGAAGIPLRWEPARGATERRPPCLGMAHIVIYEIVAIRAVCLLRVGFPWRWPPPPVPRLRTLSREPSREWPTHQRERSPTDSSSRPRSATGFWRIEVLPLDADWHYKRAFMASDGRTLYSLTYPAQPPFTASALDTEIPPGVRLEFSALWVALAQNCVAASADAQGFDCFDPFTPRDRFVMTRVRAVIPRDAFGLPEFASYHSYAAGPEANGLDRPNLGRTNAVYQVLERSRAGERKRLPKRFTLALLNPEDPERKWYEFMAVATNTVVGFSAPSVIPSLPPGEAVHFVDVRYDNWTDGVFLRITNDWPSKASVQARPE